MVDKKISELDPAGPLTGVEELAVVQGVGPDTVKTTVQKVIEAGLAFKGALVEKSTAQSIPTAVSTAVSWDAETLDIGGFWTAGQPTRLTIPSGISKVRLSSNVEWANNSTGRRDISITKNGTTLYPGVGQRTKNAVNESWDTVNTGVISVITGDYFEVIVYQNSGSSLDVGGDVFSSSWFQIEVVEEVNSSLLTGSASLGNLSDVDLVPAPTDGQTLSYNSSTSKWEPQNRDMRKVATGTVSGGEINVSGLNLSGWQHLLVVVHDLVSATDINYIKLQVKDAGGDVTGNVYRYIYQMASTGGSTRIESGATATDHLPVVGSTNSAWASGNGTGDKSFGQMLITNAQASANKGANSDFMFGFGNGSTAIGSARVAGQIDITVPIVGIRIFGTAALSSGNVTIYAYS